MYHERSPKSFFSSDISALPFKRVLLLYKTIGETQMIKRFYNFFFSKSSQIQINSLTSHVHLFGSKLPRCPPYLSQWCIELRLFLLTFCIFIGEREREKRNKEVNSEEKSDKVRRIEIKDDRMGERWIKGMLKKAKNTEKDRKR